MDNTRLILVFALGFVLLLLWQAWERDYGTVPTQQASVATEAASSEEAAVPQAPVPISAVEQKETPAASVSEKAPTIKVSTDLYQLEISTRGGDILNGLLQQYPTSVATPDDKFQLLKDGTPNLFIVQSGLLGAEPEKAPTHEARFEAEQQEYRLEEKQDSLEVKLIWRHPSGISVTKRYTFRRGSYLVEVSHEVVNNSEAPWSGREYRQLQRSPEEEGKGSAFIYTYTGGAIYSPEEKYEKIPFEDMQEAKLERSVTGGWIAMLQHYFLGAWIPDPEEKDIFYSKVLPGERYVLGMYTQPISVASGDSHRFDSHLFIGPKLQSEMAAAAPGLELTVDYGWLTAVAQPIYWLMDKIHGLVGNWGWAIICLTALIKALFYKLSEASYRSMANMRKLAPRMQALKDRYGDDKQRLNQAMMEMYKKEKINPLGGCLPILVQIPVFISLYWVLLEAVELRQAPFIFWINDLSVKDPYFVLPVIMGISMLIQQKLNPAPVDPMQAKIMMALPFVFTVFFAFFPSGLVLYWVVNNVLSITQQWYITRQIEQGATKT